MAKPVDPNHEEPNTQPRDERDRLITALSRRALERKLGSLPVASDLDDDVLLRYFDGTLSPEQRSTLERRLLVDLDARERLGILAGAFEEAGLHRPTAAAREGVAAAVSRYVFHVADGVLELLRGGHGGVVLQPAATRGVAASAAPAGFRIDREFHTAHGPVAARFELHAEHADVHTSAAVDLVVHVGAEGRPVDGVRCKLLRDGRAVDSREVEASGCAFRRLSPARYDVELRKGGLEIGRILFDLRG